MRLTKGCFAPWQDNINMLSRVQWDDPSPADKCRRGHCQRNSLPSPILSIPRNSSPGNLIQHFVPSLSVWKVTPFQGRCFSETWSCRGFVLHQGGHHCHRCCPHCHHCLPGSPFLRFFFVFFFVVWATFIHCNDSMIHNHMTVYLSVCLFECLLVCLFVYVSVCVCVVCLFVCNPFVYHKIWCTLILCALWFLVRFDKC